MEIEKLAIDLIRERFDYLIMYKSNLMLLKNKLISLDNYEDINRHIQCIIDKVLYKNDYKVSINWLSSLDLVLKSIELLSPEWRQHSINWVKNLTNASVKNIYSEKIVKSGRLFETPAIALLYAETNALIFSADKEMKKLKTYFLNIIKNSHNGDYNG